MQKRPKTSSLFCQNKCSFYIVNPILAKNILFEVRRRFNSMITFCSYKKLAIFTTNVHTKNECLCYHKTVIRSTEPPIFCRCCYKLAFFRPSLQTIVSIEFLCHCRVGCALRFIFFLEVLEIF